MVKVKVFCLTTIPLILPFNDGQNLGAPFSDNCPLLSNDGCQIQGVPPDDDSPLLSSDGRLNCLSPSAMVFAMSNDFLTQPSLAMSPVQPEGTFGNIQGQDATPSSHFQSLADLLDESSANSSPTSAVQHLSLFQNHQDLFLGTASSPHLVPSSCVHTHSRLLPSIQSLLTRMVTRLRRKFRGHPGRPP